MVSILYFSYILPIVIAWLNSLGQLIKIIREPQMVFVVDKLIEYSSGKEDELRDIAGLGELIVMLATWHRSHAHRFSSEDDYDRTARGRQDGRTCM